MLQKTNNTLINQGTNKRDVASRRRKCITDKVSEATTIVVSEYGARTNSGGILEHLVNVIHMGPEDFAPCRSKNTGIERVVALSVSLPVD